MTSFNPPELDNLKGKVVVLTGGVLGIGAELVRICHKAGAHVFFGDVLVEQGEAFAASLNSSSSNSNSPTQHVQFVRTDASDYQSNLDLFDAAFSTCGRVDHAASVAGIGERGNIVDPALTLESVRREPSESMATLHIDFVGPLYFSRIASVYLRQGASARAEGEGDAMADKSLTLVSSVAGFTEAPGLFVYSAAKHAVYGLMRALRKVLVKSSPHAIRTNAVCPWMTETRMVSGIQDDWHKAGLPRNTPEDVARVIAGAMADTSLNGEALYVEGGRAWALEEGIDRTQPQWMGEKQSREFNIGQEVLGSGEGWTN